MRAAVEAVEAEAGAVGALVNNAGYSQSGAVEIALDGGPPPPVRDQRLRPRAHVPARAARHARPRRRPDREHELDGRATSRSRAAAPTTRPSTRSRRSPTRCASRSRASASASPSSSRARSARSSPTRRWRRSPEDDGPYAAFNAEVGRATRDAYEKGPLARLGGEPDDVAKAVEKAITAKRAPIRVRVTPSAHLLVTQRRLMPDRVWDGFVGTQFKRPGA